MGNARLFLLLINISLALCAAGKLTVRLEPSDGRLFALPGKLGLACFIKPNGKASLGRYHYQQGLFTEINPHALRRRLKLRALRLAQEIRKLSSQGFNGFKILRAVPLLNFYRNIALTNGSRGFEFRGSVVAIGNLTLYHSGSGMTGIQSDDTVLNNAGAYNTGGDLLISASCGWCSNNWAQDQSGVDPRFSDPVASAGGGFSVDTDFPTGLDIAGKIAFIRSQFSRAFTPAAGSPLIDDALHIPDYHCERSDNDPVDPMPPEAVCVHWSGQAPDIGPFEHRPPAA